MLNGVQQKPIEGISFAYTFDDAKAKSRRTTQYFEMFVNRGIYHDGWMASALSFPPWQSDRGAFDPDTRSGSFTTSTRTSARPTTSLRQIRKSCASCRTCGGWRRRSTTSSRSTGAASNGLTPN